MGKNNKARRKMKKKARDVRNSKIVFYAKSKKTGMERTKFEDGTSMYTMNKELEDSLKNQKERFKKTFGRDPEPNDPLFFDPDLADRPVPIDEEKGTKIIVDIMRKADIDERYIYVLQKTGILYSEHIADLLTPDEIQEVHDAMDEYDILGGDSLN